MISYNEVEFMKIIKNKSICNMAWSFLIPALVLLTSFALFGMFPFADKSVLICDMSSQYIDYFAGLRHLLKSGEGLFYSWSKALGGEFLGLFSFYLASPFSLLVFLVPLQHLPLIMMAMMILKPALAGAAFAFYYQKVFQREDRSAVIFSVCYALMSYNILYGMSVMWLDGIYLFPLLLYGLEKILKQESPGYFLAVLTFCFLNHYYISYMMGLYCILYFFYRKYSAYPELKGKKFWTGFGKLAGSAIAAAGLAAFLLLPCFIALLSGKIGDEGIRLVSGVTFEWKDFFKKLLPGTYDTLKYDGTPNIYCGLLIVALDIWFFFRKTISGREKICTGILLGFLALSMYFAPLNCIWHVFREPNWFPFRNSFLMSFSMIFTACCLWKTLDFQKIRWKSRGMIPLLLLILTIGDLGFNAYQEIKCMDNEFGYEAYDSYRNMILELESLISFAEKKSEGFYRLEKDFYRSKNDALTLNYRGVTHYSSDYNGAMNSFIRKLGMAQDYFWCGYDGSTPVTDSIFAIRYLISKEESYHDYKKSNRSYGNFLYENPYAAGLGILTGEEILKVSLTQGSYLENQNRLFEALTGIAGVFERHNFQEPVLDNLIYEAQGEGVIYERPQDGEGRLTYEIPIEASGEYYLEFPTYDEEEYESDLYLNGTYLQKLYDSDKKGIICLGYREKGELLKLELHVYSKYFKLGYPHLYYLQEEKFAEGIAKLQKNTWNPQKFGSSYLKGTLSVPKDAVLFTTIPYEDGWTVTVDGEEAEIWSMDDTLLCISLKEGIHELEFHYRPAGFREGVRISAITLLGCIAWEVYKKKRKTIAP